MITIENLTFTYEGARTPALKAVNLTIQRGDFVGVIGESGAGKTTLFRVINGMIPHHSNGDYYGHVRVDGKDTFELSLSDIAKLVGSVFQDIDSSMVAAVVEDELLFGLENFGIPKEEIELRLQEALRRVGIEKLRDREICTLSGGQKQKVAIAAILALKPEVMMLDEPTGELDPESSRQVFRILRELNEQYQITVIVIEQKIALLCEYAKKLLVLQAGSVRYYDEVRNILTHSDELENIGVHCPRVVSLARELQKRSLMDDAVFLTVDEARDYMATRIEVPYGEV